MTEIKKCVTCGEPLVYGWTTCANPSCRGPSRGVMQNENTVRPHYYRIQVRARVLDNLSEERASTVVEVECQDLIEALGLTWNEGNVLKYLFRAGRKKLGEKAEDLKKVVTYALFAQRQDREPK